jgi:hypothetical protein
MILFPFGELESDGPLRTAEIYREGLIRLPFASFAARKGLV